MTTETITLTAALSVATAHYEKVVDLHDRSNQLAIDMIEAGLDSFEQDAASKRLDKARDAALANLIAATDNLREAEAERVVEEATPEGTLLGQDPAGNDVYGDPALICCTYECGGCINGEICGAAVDRIVYGGTSDLDMSVKGCGHSGECADLAGR